MKHRNIAKKFGTSLATVGALVASNAALAVDYTAIETAADWSDAADTVVVVGAAIALVLVALAGVRLILSAFKR